MDPKRQALKIISLLSVTITALTPLAYAQSGTSDTLSPDEALSQAYASNPEMAAAQARTRAERSLIRSEYWLDNPTIGYMRENNLDLTQQTDGPMNFWTISQNIKFPAKYFLQGSAQSSRAKAAGGESRNKALEIRQKVLSTYYSLYSAHRIHALLQAQRETLREIARIAEARRATGAVPQQDEMKAHVEQTKLESELLLQEQELTTLQATLNALLNRDADAPVELPKAGLNPPDLTIEPERISEVAARKSPAIQTSEFLLEEAQTRKSLANLSYAPDFSVSYAKPYTNALPGAYEFSVGVSIPLWFFAKQTAEVSAASAKRLEAEKNLETAQRNTHSEVRALSSRVRTYDKLIKIYTTSLIPQATSTLNSSRTAYSAGRTGFLELLDSERSLYAVRIEFYQTLTKFVESLTQLERLVGDSLSTLPFGASGK